MPFESGHINKSVQATHVTFDEQIRAVFGLNMGTKAAVLFVLLGTDGAVKRAVVTEGVEDLAGGRVLLPGPVTPIWLPPTVAITALAARLASRI